MEGFIETRLVCGDCGHELEPEEVKEQREDVIFAEVGLLRCLDCGSWEVREIDVDLRDELVRAAMVAGQRARLVVERKPEMRPRVEALLSEARSYVEALER